MFDNYKGTKENFDLFNTLVINMPRHEFESMNVHFVKGLANLLNNVKTKSDRNYTIVDLYCLLHEVIKNNTTINLNEYPYFFVTTLFNTNLNNEVSVRQYYKDNDGKARDFRHLIMLMRLWGLIESNKVSNNAINYSVCEEFIALKNDELEGLRAKIISMDIIDNPMFVTLSMIEKRIKDRTIFSYKPSINILRYMKEIGRPVSNFEISNLLGVIIPEYYSSNDLYSNAIEIGKNMPQNISEHKKWFFDYMDWKDASGQYFRYAQSQNPDFKFKPLVLFLKNLDLIKEKADGSFVLTDFAYDLLEQDVPAEVVELEKYIDIAEKSYSDKDLAALIIYNIKPSLLQYAARNEEFIKAMNIRSLTHPKHDGKGKKIRNKLIAELAKIKANYTCQVSGKPTFIDEKGNNYVEAHHIIEFNGEDGPDIVDNLIVISPLYHSLIHHARKDQIDDLYRQLRINNVITIDQFKKIIDNYGCLNEKHFDALYEKGLITNIERNDLLDYYENSNIN